MGNYILKYCICHNLWIKELNISRVLLYRNTPSRDSNAFSMRWRIQSGIKVYAHEDTQTGRECSFAYLKIYRQ